MSLLSSVLYTHKHGGTYAHSKLLGPGKAEVSWSPCDEALEQNLIRKTHLDAKNSGNAGPHIFGSNWDVLYYIFS